jgi:hypothetical protein
MFNTIGGQRGGQMIFTRKGCGIREMDISVGDVGRERKSTVENCKYKKDRETMENNRGGTVRQNTGGEKLHRSGFNGGREWERRQRARFRNYNRRT